MQPIHQGHVRRAGLGLAVAASLLFLVGPAEPRDRAAGEQLARWVPANTYAYLTVPCVKDARAAFKRSAFCKLWNDPEVQTAAEPTRKALDEKWDEFEKEFEKNAGLSFDDAVEVLDGELSVALVGLPRKNEGPDKIEVLLALDTGDHKDRAAKLLAQGTEELKKQDASYKESAYDFKGYSITTLAGQDATFRWTFVGSTVLLGTGQAAFEEALTAASSGRQACLADDPQFTKVRAEAGKGKENVFFYLNARDLLALYEPDMSEEAMRALSGLGLSDARGVGVAVGMDGDDVVDSAYVLAPEPRKGLLQAISLAPAPPRDLSLVPKDAVAAMYFHLDPAQTWDDVLAAVRTVSGPEESKQVDDAIARMEEESGIRVRQDLVASLGSGWVSYSAFPEAGGIYPDSVTSVDLKDPARFEACVEAVAQRGKWKVTSLQFQGETIRYLTGIEWAVGGPGRSPTVEYPLAFLVRDGVLHFSNSVHALKRLVARAHDHGAAIDQNPLWQASAARVGTCGGLLYYDFAKLFTVGYNTIAPIGEYFQGFLNQAGVPLDLARLPLGETLAKYVSASVTTISGDKEGIRIDSRSSIGLSITGVMGTAVVAAIAIPSLLRSRIAANETSAQACLKQFVSTEGVWRQIDADRNGVQDYWVDSIEDFYSFPDAAGNPLRFIDVKLAKADFGKLRADAVPKSGYYFAVIQKDAAGTPYSERKETGYAFCAWPAEYNKTGVRTYVVNEEGVVYQLDLGVGGAVEQWPADDPTTAGWVPSE